MYNTSINDLTYYQLIASEPVKNKLFRLLFTLNSNGKINTVSVSDISIMLFTVR